MDSVLDFLMSQPSSILCLKIQAVGFPAIPSNTVVKALTFMDIAHYQWFLEITSDGKLGHKVITEHVKAYYKDVLGAHL